jgi:hypothetical protein
MTDAYDRDEEPTDGAASNQHDDDPAAAVGYGKPPRQHRFKSGQSGNPRGRPKGARGLRAELAAEMNELVTVMIDGKPMHISKLRVIIKALAQRAAKGNVAAADKLLSLIIQSQGFEDTRPGKRELTATEYNILAQMLGEDIDPPAEEPASAAEMPTPAATPAAPGEEPSP